MTGRRRGAPTAAGWALAGLVLAGLALGSRAGARGGGAAAGMAPAQPPSPGPIYLPFAYRDLPCDAACRTATARASRTPRTATPTPSPRPSLTPTPSATATASQTSRASDTPRDTLTPSPTGPSPTASRTRTATPPPTATPLPTGGPADPANDRVQPLAALAPGRGKVVYDETRRTYRLQLEGSPALTFEVDLTHPDIANGRLAVRHVQSNRYPVAGAGLFYRTREGGLLEPRILRLVGRVSTVEHAALADGLQLTVRETLEETPHAKRYTLRMVGRALEIRAESLDPPGPAAGGYAGYGGGDIEGSSDGVDLRLPYMAMVPLTMLDHRWFVTHFVDYARSQAGSLLARGPEAEPGGFINEVAVLYQPDTGAAVRAVDERAWVVVSPRIEDLFLALPGGGGRWRADLAGKVLAVLRSRPETARFADEAALLERWRGWGMTELVVAKPAWQDPTALSPAQLPPAAVAGGAEGFRRLTATAGLLAAGQAYTLTLPGCPGKLNPAYRPEDRVMGADGQAKGLSDETPGGPRCGNGVPVRRNLMAPAGAAQAAATAWPGLKALGVGASYLPELAAWSPAWPWPGADDNVLDQAAQTGHPATLAEAVAAYKAFFAGLQRQGPLLADGGWGIWEAGYDTLYAGYLDGLARSLATGSLDQWPADGALVVPDYELALARPRLLGYGMGPYERFFGPEATAGPLTDAQLDALRAATLSFGHAGAWWAGPAPGAAADSLGEAEMAKEYFTLRPLQARYLDAPAVSVRYLAPDDTALDLSTALKGNLDLAGPRLLIRYGEALTLWLNHGASAWPVAVGGEIHTLPPDGWLAVGADGLLAYSALLEGRRVDYVWTRDYVLMDGRGRTTFFGSHSARDLKVVFADGRVLEEGPDGRLTMTPP